MSARPLTPRMLRELRTIASSGEVSDLYEYATAGALAFQARERVLDALVRRGLIGPGDGDHWHPTAAGQDVLIGADR